MATAEQWRAELEHERWEVYDIKNNLRHFEACRRRRPTHPPQQQPQLAHEPAAVRCGAVRCEAVRCGAVHSGAAVQNVLVMAWDLQVMRAHAPSCAGSAMYTEACPSYHISSAITKSVVRTHPRALRLHRMLCAMGRCDGIRRAHAYARVVAALNYGRRSLSDSIGPNGMPAALDAAATRALPLAAAVRSGVHWGMRTRAGECGGNSTAEWEAVAARWVGGRVERRGRWAERD